jgi:hypothetical protein
VKPRRASARTARRSPARQLGRGARILGVERFECLVNSVRGDALPLEVVADERIAVAARRERLCASQREARVVDQARTSKRLDRSVSFGGRDAAADEPLSQRTLAHVPVP